MARFTLALLAALPALITAQSYTTYSDTSCSKNHQWNSIPSMSIGQTKWVGFPGGTQCVKFEGMEEYYTTIYYNGGEKTFENFNNGYYDWTYSKGIWGANVYFWDG